MVFTLGRGGGEGTTSSEFRFRPRAPSPVAIGAPLNCRGLRLPSSATGGCELEVRVVPPGLTRSCSYWMSVPAGLLLLAGHFPFFFWKGAEAGHRAVLSYGLTLSGSSEILGRDGLLMKADIVARIASCIA